MSDDSATGETAADSGDDDLLDIGPRGNGPSWPGQLARRLQRVPNGARWTIAAVAVAALASYGASRPIPHRSARPAPTTSASPRPAAGTQSHYPGLLQEYNDQRARGATAAVTAQPRP